MRLSSKAGLFVAAGLVITTDSFAISPQLSHRLRPLVRQLPSWKIAHDSSCSSTAINAVGSSQQRQNPVDISVLHPYSGTNKNQNVHDLGLLSKDEEIILARLVQQRILWEEIRSKLATKLKREPTLSEWAMNCGRGWINDEEFVFALHKSEEAKAAIINANLRLVVNLARKHKSQCRTRLQVSDLIHEGIFGLFKASEKFDPERGFRFATCATWWIRQSIARAVANHGRIVRLPVHVQDSLQSVRRVQRGLSVQLGRDATEEELARKLGVTPDKLEWLYSCQRKEPVSLHVQQFATSFKPDQDDYVDAVEDSLTDTDLTPEDHLNHVAMQDHLNNLLLRLHPRERIVVRLRYGLDNGGHRETFTRIGSEVGVAKERARQIESKALERLRKYGSTATAIEDETRSYLV